MKTRSPQKNTHTGFTLLETLVAITVLMLVLVTVLSVASTSLSKGNDIRDRLTASYLAQDAMEFIRNMRDSNVLTGGQGSWLSGFACMVTYGSLPPLYCTINTMQINSSPTADATALDVCNGACLLSKATLGGVFRGYGYQPSSSIAGDRWDVSKFSRKIYFEQINASEIIVHVIVSWSPQGAGAPLTFQLQENLLEWQ